MIQSGNFWIYPRIFVCRRQSHMTAFWDTSSVIHIDILSRKVCENHFARRDRAWSYFQWDSIPGHIETKPTTISTEEKGWEVLHNPTYKPGLAASVFHLFGPLQESLGGEKFELHKQVEEHILHALRRLWKSFIQRWKRYFESEAEYV